MGKVFLFFILPVIILGSVLSYLHIKYPQTPLQKSAMYFTQHLFNLHANLQKETIGFLPYWRMEDAKYIRFNMLSDFDFFSLSPDQNGNLQKISGTETEPGWREWHTQNMKDLITKAHIMGSKVSFTVTSQDNGSIESLLNNPAAQDNLIKDILDQLSYMQADGVNIDFEYSGDADQETRDRFTTFSQKINTALHKGNKHYLIMLSLMPLAARSNDIFDFEKIANLYDRYIGMSYDYYGVSSDVSGPVAPMSGFAKGKYFFDIVTTYQDYQKYLPKNKIIMGVPYYGWDRAVTDPNVFMSTTLSQGSPDNYAAIESYSRMKEDNNIDPKKCTWDADAQAQWCKYSDKKGTGHQIWLEDKKSLGIKYDYANQQNFQGIAIWVLGYDKNYSDLWDLLSDKFWTK
jgi:spore germination protein YaaH